MAFLIVATLVAVLGFVTYRAMEGSRSSRSATTGAFPAPPHPQVPLPPTVGAKNLMVTSAPEGAMVTLDGVNRGVTPVRLKSLAGDTVMVELTRAGFAPIRERVALVPGEQRFDRVLTRAGSGSAGSRPAAPAFQRSYRVNTRPGAALVYVDGSSRAHEMAFDITLSEGRHQFRLVNDALGVDVNLSYEVKRGDEARVLLLDYETRQVLARP
jgi:hypothetical protein